MSVRHWFTAVFVTGVAIGAVVFAQAPSAVAPTTLEALLLEVRGLRADLNQTAGTSIRTQLLVARLQLQEQRINGIVKQLNDVQTQRSALDNGLLQMDSHSKQMEDRERNPSTTPEERRAIAQERTGMKPALEQMTRHRQELVNQENGLAAQLSSEQTTWSDFNARLDQIEREIAVRR